MAELRRQRAAAREALEERASSYSLGVPSGHGRHSKRFARGPAEREEALERYRQVADAAFDQILAEAEELSRLPLGPDWRARLGPGLRRRRRFWEGQLEEAWSAWQEATTAMHRAGDEAVDAWRSVGELAELAGPAGGLREAAPAAPPAALQEGMVLLAARGLEAELVGAMGLSGLSDGGCHFDCRAELLLEVLEALRAAGALADVGDALLGGGVAAEWLAAQDVGLCSLLGNLMRTDLKPSPELTQSRVDNVQGCAALRQLICRLIRSTLTSPWPLSLASAAQARLRATQVRARLLAQAGRQIVSHAAMGSPCTREEISLPLWPVHCPGGADLVELAELLGGAGFGEAVQGEAARRCSGDAAAAADHGAVACVLQGSRLRSCATAAEVCGVLAESALEDGLEPEDDEHGPP
ncbi:unnamed protein product [Prorocentrum cordatum]|uniref:Nuclear pore complex protein n=1 Tax=Prorocentrum cordatum TaxID=2364126 RepID=A0ABN9WBU6_9DINO|nr:unnamed protein product [Polarella glacialis]